MESSHSRTYDKSSHIYQPFGYVFWIEYGGFNEDLIRIIREINSCFNQRWILEDVVPKQWGIGWWVHEPNWAGDSILSLQWSSSSKTMMAKLVFLTPSPPDTLVVATLSQPTVWILWCSFEEPQRKFLLHWSRAAFTDRGRRWHYLSYSRIASFTELSKVRRSAIDKTLLFLPEIYALTLSRIN